MHDVTSTVAILAGQGQGEFRTAGCTKEFQEVVIGATAHSCGMSLLTRNRKDFEEMEVKGLRVCNPWDR